MNLLKGARWHHLHLFYPCRSFAADAQQLTDVKYYVARRIFNAKLWCYSASFDVKKSQLTGTPQRGFFW